MTISSGKISISQSCWIVINAAAEAIADARVERLSVLGLAPIGCIALLTGAVVHFVVHELDIPNVPEAPTPKGCGFNKQGGEQAFS